MDLDGKTDYCDEIKTRCRGSLDLWPMPVDVQVRLAMRQLEHGYSLSQRIYTSGTCKVILVFEDGFIGVCF